MTWFATYKATGCWITRALSLFSALLCSAQALQAADAERIVREVRFAQGTSVAVQKGRIQSYQYVDLRLRASAGQRLEANLAGSSRSTFLNLLPPGSDDAAMFIGTNGGDRYAGLLPDDGVYVLRVYQMRNEARRNRISDYAITIRLSGKPLQALSPGVDALVPGTRYHAQTTAPCEPRYTQVRTCEAGVVRRGTDGTATVEMRWAPNGTRRILFVKGEPLAVDAAETFTFSRDAQGYNLIVGGDERFAIPEVLIFGG